MKTDRFFIEPLESRIAPAAVVINANSARYLDVDGDQVTVVFSKPIITNANVNQVLLTSSASSVPEQLQTIDLVTPSLATSASGTDISFVVVKAPGGDGLVNVGYINATGIDLAR